MANEVQSNAASRAERVCNTCKTRKKACDKRLPQCGYCSKRDLACSYDDYSGDTSSLATEINSSADFPIVLSSELTTLRNPLALHVCRVLESSGLSLLELIDYFFRSFHTWFPVISPRLLHETILAAGGNILPAEFSILILTMYLIIHRRHSKENQARPDDIYVTVKILFAQTQAVLLPSTTLLQTSILIAAYEYATTRSSAAYISIGTCIRMAQSIGLARIEAVESVLLQDEYSVLRALEQRNIWWAVVILERLIISEVQEGNRIPTTDYPSPDSPLPSDFGLEEQFLLQPLGLAALRSPPVSNIRGANIGYFARHAQAAFLLDRFLNLIHLPLDRDTRYFELKKLDEDVQSFMSLLMGEARWAKRLGCGAIAHSIRLLFLIHQYNLSHSTPTELEADERRREKMSLAALDTAARIMIDVARTLLHTHKFETMPLCCANISRVAHDHIKNGGSDGFKEIRAKDIAPLVALETMFNTKWALR